MQESAVHYGKSTSQVGRDLGEEAYAAGGTVLDTLYFILYLILYTLALLWLAICPGPPVRLARFRSAHSPSSPSAPSFPRLAPSPALPGQCDDILLYTLYFILYTLCIRAWYTSAAAARLESEGLNLPPAQQ